MVAQHHDFQIPALPLLAELWYIQNQKNAAVMIVYLRSSRVSQKAQYLDPVSARSLVLARVRTIPAFWFGCC